MTGQHPAVLKAECSPHTRGGSISPRPALPPRRRSTSRTRRCFTEAVARTPRRPSPGRSSSPSSFIAKKLPRDFFPQVNEAINKFADDPTFAKLRADVLRRGLLLSLEPSQVDKIRQEVEKKGNAQKGKELYLNTKLLACATCHRMEGVGGSVGPDLTRLWDTATVEKILESIIEPSKEIKEGFQSYRLVTADAKTYTGLKVKDDAKEVVIRDANGRDIRVDKDDVESAIRRRNYR